MKTIKKVNISAPRQIHNVLPLPIIGEVKGLNLDTDQIYTCLCKGATVKEVLSSGVEVLLGVLNYFTNNEAVLTESERLEVEAVAQAKIDMAKAETDAADATKKFAEDAEAAKVKFQDEALKNINAAAEPKADEVTEAPAEVKADDVTEATEVKADEVAEAPADEVTETVTEATDATEAPEVKADEVAEAPAEVTEATETVAASTPAKNSYNKKK